MAEVNPFTTQEGAEQWVEMVEGQDPFRNNYIYPRVDSWLRQLPEDSVVADIGSGQGKCSELMLGGMKYVGIEPSIPLAERAQELYGAGHSRMFVVGDAYNTGLKDKSVDAVLSINVLFHLENIDSAIQEAARVLKPLGQAFFVSVNPKGYEKWRSYYDIREEQGKMIRGKLDFGGDTTLEDNTFYQHSWEEIETAFEEAGMKLFVVEDFPPDRQTAIRLQAIKLLDS